MKLPAYDEYGMTLCCTFPRFLPYLKKLTHAMIPLIARGLTMPFQKFSKPRNKSREFTKKAATYELELEKLENSKTENENNLPKASLT